MFPESDRALLKILSHATALQPLSQLEKHLGLRAGVLWIKRDDELFNGLGGNKARKLEFVLGDFQKRGIKELVTFGAWGSNHVMMTALCAQKFGFKLKAHLSPQPMTEDVKSKLAALKAMGVDLRFHANSISIALSVLANKKHPGFIYPGASTSLGSMGYVKAAFELMEQLREKDLSGKKLKIFLPAGSLGTVAGLLVGFAIQDIPIEIQVNAVQVVPLHWNLGRWGILKQTREVIQALEPNRDHHNLLQKKVRKMLNWLPWHYRPRYGEAKPEVIEHMNLFEQLEKIPLDITYTGKTINALIQIMKDTPLQENEMVLFWNTYPKIFKS